MLLALLAEGMLQPRGLTLVLKINGKDGLLGHLY
jgi:hypothetical protein